MTAISEAFEMIRMISGGLYLTHSLYVAARLGVADLLIPGPQTATELAGAAGVHAPSLHRVMRALASVGVFTEDPDGRFALTARGRLLASGPGSLRSVAMGIGAPWHTRVWESLLHTVQTGETAWDHATGESLFQYFASHPEHAALFDGMMTEFSIWEAAAVAEAYDFTGIHTTADIAGGHGWLLATILQRYPTMRGILFDLPHVTSGAGSALSSHALNGRCEVISGDMFHCVPGGADAYLLKNVLHDWDDVQAAKILSSVRRAMPPGSRILVIQEALPLGGAPSAGKLLDMQMLLIGGKERTHGEYEQLFAQAGLRLTRLIPTAAPVHVIEGAPA